MGDDGSGRVAIVGAGLGGALMGAALAGAGYDVDIYERRSDPRGREVAAGRSINLAISTRGLHALAQVGIERQILDVAVRMPGRMIHAPDGQLSFQPYSKNAIDAINSVSRLGLNIALLNAAEKCENLRVFFDHRCVGVDLDTATVEFSTGRSNETRRVKSRFVIGADGAFSAVRAQMQRTDRFSFSQSYLEHGYKELTVLPSEDGRHQLEKNALHIWPRKSFMMIALPNCDGSFTCTLFWPFEGPNSFAAIRSEDDVLRFFNEQFRDAVPLLPNLAEDFRQSPTSSLVTVRCGPWSYRDKVVLLGDACHAVVPFYGQGANAAFEDCTVLHECIAAHAPDLGRAFAEYYEKRKRHCDTLADLAIGNFLEMRDRTGSKTFLLKKKGEKLMHRLLPGWYVPLYSMVTFSRIPYADAVDRSNRQHRVIRNVVVVIALLVVILVVRMLLG
ncbi:MAG: NAD(P)/FAD-dependent oxidoreductase [Planctomycetota bacterium]|nr:NAD(P)/FAD-dependent oxidoreductase [Planctomycetota bacterium]